MDKVDLRKEWGPLYKPSAKQPEMVTVPKANFVMLDGKGNPNTAPEYTEALQALYNLVYTLKFLPKKSGVGVDFTVMPLEGLWWAEDTAAFALGRKDDWLWTMMIMVPDGITPGLFARALEQAREKREAPALARIRLEKWKEGRCAQILHLGPYAAEAPTIQKLHAFILESGYEPAGKHHEIYMGDPRRSAPEKLKTIIRQPIKKRG